MSMDKFKETYGEPPSRDKMTMLWVSKSQSTDQIFVYFPDSTERLGIAPIRHYCETMGAKNVHRAILVLRNGLTSMARQALEQFHGKFNIEQFDEDQLLINITKHVLVPKHELLSEDERTELLGR